MYAYLCGTTYSVTLVATHVQWILVNHKIKGYLYMSHKKSPDPCATNYCVPYWVHMRSMRKHEFYGKKEGNKNEIL